MKKGLLLLLAGLMAFFGMSAKAMADARTDSMSADVREIGDIDLIWYYPNMILDYKGTADFRLNTNGLGGTFGDGVGEWGGVIVDETSTLGGVVATYVNRPNTLETTAGTLIAPLPVLGTPLRSYFTPAGNITSDATNIFDEFWATDLGGGSNLGFHFGYGDNGLPADQAAQWSLSAGLGVGAVGPFNTLNIHADYATEDITDTALATNNKSQGISSVKVGVLGRSDVSDTNYINSFLDLTFDNDNLTNLDDETASDTTLVLGLACNHKIDSGKGLLSTGLMFGWLGGDTETEATTTKIYDDENTWDLLWNGSVEAEATDWLTVRAGLQKLIVGRQFESNPASYTDNSSGDDVAFSTGFGINWENWVLNGDVEAETLEGTISGVQPGKGIFFGGAGENIVTVEEADLSYKF